MSAPIRQVGEKSAAERMAETMAVAVLFPWVPETAMGFSKREKTLPRHSALSIMGIFRSFARTNSGLSAGTAEEYTKKRVFSGI